MGSRNADRLHPGEWRTVGGTVRKIRERGWIITARCELCGVHLRVDLRVIEANLGPDFILWGKRPLCKVVRCRGRMWFVCEPHPRARVFDMTDVEPA